MNTTVTAETPPDETIEYGGLVWSKTDSATRLEYKTAQPGVGKYYIYQYPLGEDSCCAGQWLWRVNFDTLLDAEFKPSILNMEASQIVGTNIEEAMQACLDAKNRFLTDIKMLTMQLGIGNYPTGFMDGQAALAEKIKMVMP